MSVAHFDDGLCLNGGTFGERVTVTYFGPLPHDAVVGDHLGDVRPDEADLSRRRLERDRVVVRHGDIEGRATHVLRARRAADGAIVRRATIGRADDERLSEAITQRLELVERLLVDPQGAVTPAARSSSSARRPWARRDSG